MVTFLLCAAAIALVALIACRQQRDAEPEPTEFGAAFDALAADRAKVGEIKRKSRANERLIVAEAMAAKLGPPHDPVEL